MRIAAAALILLAAAIPAAVVARPPRVMSLNLCADQYLLALLPAERITSVTALARDPTISLMAKAAAGVPANRGTAEEVLRQRPDLVIAGTYTTPATRALLKRAGVRMIEIGPAEDFEAIARLTRQIAAAVGEPSRGEALLRSMDATLARIAETRRGPPIRVAAWNGSGFTAGAGTLHDAILTTAGAQNIAGDARLAHYARLDVEVLLEAAPALLVRSERQGRSDHPLVARYWRDRTVLMPQAAHICGTPFAAMAALRLHGALQAATR